MRTTFLPGLAVSLVTTLAVANEAGTAAPSPVVDDSNLEVVLVMGEQPGPGLWKVSSGEHVLWILGEISPFPRKVKWKSKKFDNLLRNSQELLIDFSGYWWANEGETAALVSAGRLPDGQALKDVISPELYVRVEATARNFGSPSLAELRPFSATNRLVSSVMETLELSGFSARFAAAELGQKRRVRITYVAVPEIDFEQRLRHWQDASNSVCLERLVQAIEDGGTGLRRLANAWSIGDIEALRELVPSYSFSRDGFRAEACAAAMHGGERQSSDYKIRRTQIWLDEALRALRENRRTMAVVPMSELFAVDGYLAGLRAQGYEVVEPE